MFLNTATHGTDQLMVQRLLVARNQRDSRTALLFSGGVILIQFTLFLLVGAGLLGLLSPVSSHRPFRYQLTMCSPHSLWSTCRAALPDC